MEKFDRITQDALKKWGDNVQKEMLVEECGELIVAIKHEKRGKCTSEDVLSELADVFILVMQMAHVYGAENFEKHLRQKMERLEETIASQP